MLVALLASIVFALTAAPDALAGVPTTNVTGNSASTHPMARSAVAPSRAHGSAVFCQRPQGGPLLGISFAGTEREAHSGPNPLEGFPIPNGKSHRFASPSEDRHTYQCTSSPAQMRCFDIKTKHLFLISAHVARLF